MQALHIHNGLLNGERTTLAMESHILPGPVAGALDVDLDGFSLWPALINAHDHLELNHFPRSKFRRFYENAHQWGAELNAWLRRAPYRQGRAYPLEDRLFLGGLKNLLCGALTVLHHNPYHAGLAAPEFPVTVPGRYGWAHSLHFEANVVESYLKAERDVPWIIHLAEGVDETAALEYGRLKKLGCVQSNTVIVHGVGLTQDDILDGARGIRGLVWCPSSNRYLLGYTADVELWQQVGGRVALGSDSRLTADGDLLDELRAALETGQVTPEAALAMVTTTPAALFDLPDVGVLAPGCRADWVATRGDTPLVGSRRADLALVVRGGVPQLGDPDVMARFSQITTVPALLDGRSKAIHAALAERIMACELVEPGLELEGQPAQRQPSLWRQVRVLFPS